MVFTSFENKIVGKEQRFKLYVVDLLKFATLLGKNLGALRSVWEQSWVIKLYSSFPHI